MNPKDRLQLLDSSMEMSDLFELTLILLFLAFIGIAVNYYPQAHNWRKLYPEHYRKWWVLGWVWLKHWKLEKTFEMDEDDYTVDQLTALHKKENHGYEWNTSPQKRHFEAE